MEHRAPQEVVADKARAINTENEPGDRVTGLHDVEQVEPLTPRRLHALPAGLRLEGPPSGRRAGQGRPFCR